MARAWAAIAVVPECAGISLRYSGYSSSILDHDNFGLAQRDFKMRESGYGGEADALAGPSFSRQLAISRRTRHVFVGRDKVSQGC